MAPYSDACSVDAFGPCLANALELTGDTLQLAALAADESVPRMLPLHVRQPNFMQEEVKVALAKIARLCSVQHSVQPDAAEAVASVSAQQSDSTQVLLGAHQPGSTERRNPRCSARRAGREVVVDTGFHTNSCSDPGRHWRSAASLGLLRRGAFERRVLRCPVTRLSRAAP